VPKFSPFSRRQSEVRRFEEAAAKAAALAAENGYRGNLPSQVPIDPAAPPTTEPDGFAHYASQAQLAESRLTGHPVQALCGRVWIPVTQTAGLPVCPRCDEVYRAMPVAPPGGRRR
jgi:uncharacterized Zn-finger protein